MNGLATRKQLTAALHPDVHGDVSVPPCPFPKPIPPPLVDVEEVHIFGFGRASDEIAFPDRPFMPNFSNLGTPGEVERTRAVRIEAEWVRAAITGIACVLILVAIWFVNTPAPKQPHPVSESVQYRARAASLVPGRMTCELNREGCLVCMHKDRLGHLVVSTHC